MKLKDFIKENRDDFNTKKMPREGRVRFEKQLQEELHGTTKVHKLNQYILKIAASIVLLLGAYFLGKFNSSIDSPVEVVDIKTKNLKTNEMLGLSLMANNSPHIRIEGINSLGEVSKPDEMILNALIDRLFYDKNVTVRLTALRGLENHMDMDVVKNALIKSLSIETDSRIQVSIIHLLININEKRALKSIKKLLENEDVEPKVRAHINTLLPQLI